MEIITVDGEKANARGTAQLWMSCPGPNSMIKDIPKQALSFCKLPKNLGAVLGRRWRTDYTSVAATPFEFDEDGFKKKKMLEIFTSLLHAHKDPQVLGYKVYSVVVLQITL